MKAESLKQWRRMRRRRRLLLLAAGATILLAAIAAAAWFVFLRPAGLSPSRSNTTQLPPAATSAVSPLDLKTVSANVFTAPEIATVGVSQTQVDSGEVQARTVTLPLRGNPRAKMQGSRDGFVKLFCRSVTGIVIGGVVVAPRASELIYPVAIAVAERLTVDQVSQSFTVYPSMTGSLAEAARRLHGTRSIIS